MEVLKVHLRTVRDFQDSYARDLPNGGLFCPTTKEQTPDHQVFVEVNANLLPNRVLIRGIIKWWRPALPRRRVRAGALVEFEPSEAAKREFLVKALGGETNGSIRKRKHTRLPLELPARYRMAKSTEVIRANISEISTGGALLRTQTPLAIGTEVTLDVVPPGAVQAMSIAAKATYHSGPNTGLKFLYRDGGGSHRLKELIRRIRAA